MGLKFVCVVVVVWCVFGGWVVLGCVGLGLGLLWGVGWFGGCGVGVLVGGWWVVVCGVGGGGFGWVVWCWWLWVW